MTTLMTWNIQSGRGVDGQVDLARVVTDACRAADFDVLCLQEVSAGYPALSGTDDHDQFMRLAALLDGYVAFIGAAVDMPAPDGGRRIFGNMLFSRLPVLQVFRHMLPWPADSGTMSMQRLALEVTVQTSAGLLRVTTTHLEYYSALQRAEQVERLRDLHEEAVALAHSIRPDDTSGGPFAVVPRAAASVLMGDFNFLPESPDRMRLLAPTRSGVPPYCDAWELSHPSQPHDPSVGLYDKAQWPEPCTFDFAFISEDLKGRIRELHVDNLSKASDHQALILTID